MPQYNGNQILYGYSKDLTGEEFAEFWLKIEPHLPHDAYLWVEWPIIVKNLRLKVNDQILEQVDPPLFVGTIERFREKLSFEILSAKSQPNFIWPGSSEGKIFWANGELRWLRFLEGPRKPIWRTAFIGEKPPKVLEEVFHQREEIFFADTTERFYIIRGLKKGFDPKSMPQTGPNQLIRIVCLQYFDRDGQLLFERYQNFVN